MTIIQPSGNKNNKINILPSFFILVIIVSIIFSVFLYNQSVNFRHDITKQETSLKNLEIQNAELKNTLFQATDSNAVNSLENDRNLVIEKNPQYVKNDGSGQLTVNN